MVSHCRPSTLWPAHRGGKAALASLCRWGWLQTMAEVSQGLARVPPNRDTADPRCCCSALGPRQALGPPCRTCLLPKPPWLLSVGTCSQAQISAQVLAATVHCELNVCLRRPKARPSKPVAGCFCYSRSQGPVTFPPRMKKTPATPWPQSPSALAHALRNLPRPLFTMRKLAGRDPGNWAAAVLPLGDSREQGWMICPLPTGLAGCCWGLGAAEKAGPTGTPAQHTHHDSSEQTHALPAVCVGHHVTIANGQERDGDEPHGSQEIARDILLVVVPAKQQRKPLLYLGSVMGETPGPPCPGHLAPWCLANVLASLPAWGSRTQSCSCPAPHALSPSSSCHRFPCSCPP